MKNCDKFLILAKDRLHNDLLDEMRLENIKFPNDPDEAVNTRYVNIIVNCLWYIDGNMATINNRSKNTKKVVEIPSRYGSILTHEKSVNIL